MVRSLARRLVRRGAPQAGAAAVEFALLAPIFLLVVFEIVNFGFIFANQVALTNGARQAARLGVVPGAVRGTGKSCADIALAARDSALGLGMKASDIKVTVTGVSASCALAVNSTTVVPVAPTTDATKPLCSQSVIDSPPLVVQLEFLHQSLVPVPPNQVTLKAIGSFKCEYA